MWLLSVIQPCNLQCNFLRRHRALTSKSASTVHSAVRLGQEFESIRSSKEFSLLRATANSSPGPGSYDCHASLRKSAASTLQSPTASFRTESRTQRENRETKDRMALPGPSDYQCDGSAFDSPAMEKHKTTASFRTESRTQRENRETKDRMASPGPVPAKHNTSVPPELEFAIAEANWEPPPSRHTEWRQISVRSGSGVEIAWIRVEGS